MFKTAFVCVALSSLALAQHPIRVLIVSGQNNHDWNWTSKSLEGMLERTGKFDADVTYEPAKALADKDALAHYQAIVLDYNGDRWGEPAESTFLDAVKNGAGVAVIHAANNAFKGWTEYEKLVGDLWRDGTGHGSFHTFDIKVVDATHPITAGLGEIKAHPDELYHKLVRTPGTNMKVLATAFSDKNAGGSGDDEPMILVGTYGKGRVFHTPLGHVWPGSEDQRVSQNDPQFQKIVTRGVEWAATGQVTPEKPSAARPASAAAEWKTLFDGKSTAAWRGYKLGDFPKVGWSVADGALVCAHGGEGGDLVTKEQFGDFELEFEWRTTPKANSGVMYRVVELDGPSWYSGPEYQVLDDGYFDGKVDYAHSAGAIYDICPADPAVKSHKSGEWNQARIVVKGSKVEHYLNGALVAQCDFASADGRARVEKSKFAPLTKPLQFMTNARGSIALQDHGDEVAYRNIRVRSLDAAAVELFNGKDLDGWTWIAGSPAPVEQVWSVAPGGEVVCKGSPAGYIRTTADYTNYVLDLDWRWNPDAAGDRNSGVLLRMIGADGVWPKSIEAQLQADSAGDFWVIQEFPCKTDPARTNGRNCKKLSASNEKPLGEWNHYKITVDHSNVTLEVNGKVMNALTDALETPGKICLQSEGAEIRFRNARLTPLP